MENLHIADWPDVIVPVQTLSDSGILYVPQQYIRPLSERPSGNNTTKKSDTSVKIPTIDLAGFASNDEHRKRILEEITDACRNWGFFQVVNHGVDLDDVKRMRQGYGSRVGVDKAAILDWSDYYFLNLFPTNTTNPKMWPNAPCNLRDVTQKYTCHMMNLSSILLKAISNTLELDEEHLHMAFGGSHGISANMRVTYYPKCPQPDLTLGLSPHTDVGGITLLLLDDNNISGTQVRKENEWVTLQSVPGAFIVNVGDQIQIISNGKYKSVEHRVLANSDQDRVNIAFFCNPEGDFPIAPASKLVSPVSPALYHPKTFNEYRKYARIKGINVREQIESSDAK
ncbi:unnamed protein product [Urochloa decumbens]|uniref:Fe2OG dioxygenase domain-containing protein n=1 Tax=Urochloa decumbens TaxID=240449 RepID=A0ABC9D7B4_9POAL